VTAIGGVLSFINNGYIVLGGHDYGSDGLIDAVLNAPGAAFSGTGTIELDANLWSDTQSKGACTTFALTAADCMIVGSTSGNNSLLVTDTYAHALGAFNPVGIVIVSGSSSASTFHLDSDSSWFTTGGGNEFGGATNILDKPGLFFYDLAFDAPNNDEVLISVPKAAAFEFATLVAAADDIWYATTQVWFDRQADLRNTIDGRADGTQPGVWLKAVGIWTNQDRTQSYSDYNRTYLFNVDYKQTTTALIGGVDVLSVYEKNKAWVLGVQGGYVSSDLNFKASHDSYKLTGGTVGVYGTYLSGGLFVDGQINVNFLNNKGSLLNLNGSGESDIPMAFRVSDNVRTVGGQIEAGYEMPLGAFGAGAFWEPLGVLSYVSTDVGDLALPGGFVHVGNADSFRGSLGLRFGGTVDGQYYRMKFSLTGRAWDEFSNNTSAALVIAGGPNFVNHDNMHGLFGDISGQMNIFSNTNGVSGFLDGGIKFNSGYTEGSVTLGARYQF
jgi:hypothetical protein